MVDIKNYKYKPTTLEEFKASLVSYRKIEKPKLPEVPKPTPSTVTPPTVREDPNEYILIKNQSGKGYSRVRRHEALRAKRHGNATILEF